MVERVLAGLGAAAVVTLAALARQDRTVRPEHGLAAAPWMVAGALAHVLAGTSGYPDALRPLFGAGAVYLATAVAAALLWFPFREAAVRRGSMPDGTRLAAGGAGAATALVTVLLIAHADVTVRSAVFLIGMPVVAGVVAVVLGLAHHEVDPVGVGRTRGLGMLVLFGAGVSAGAWALLLRDDRGIGGPAGEALAMAPGSVPVGPVPVAAATLAVGLVALSVLGRLTERNEPVGSLAATAVAAVLVGPGVEALLRATVLM